MIRTFLAFFGILAVLAPSASAQAVVPKSDPHPTTGPA